jgi:MoaA/NifB/PqqE/SkfB family radical SAM enzyme
LQRKCAGQADARPAPHVSAALAAECLYQAVNEGLLLLQR